MFHRQNFGFPEFCFILSATDCICYFYKHISSHSLTEIEAAIKTLETEIVAELREITGWSDFHGSIARRCFYDLTHNAG